MKTPAASRSSAADALPQLGFRGWQMVARGFLCQNVATGFLFGTFGTTLLAVQARFHASLATVALGMALALLTMGLLSPLTTKLLQVLTLRWTMMCGVVLSGAGYGLLAIVPTSQTFLLVFALLIGPSIALLGSLPASILASNWFVAKQGTAVGIVNVPLFVTIAPIVAIGILDRYGLTTFYLSLAACHVVLVPIVLTIVERPALIGQVPLGADVEADPILATSDGAATASVSLLKQKVFWLMIAGGGVMNAIGIIAVAHIAALAVERGIGTVQGALLVSVIGGSAMVGALLIGLLCDRIGAAAALALVAAGVCAAWAIIYLTTWLPGLLLAVALHGICVGGVFPAVNVLSRHYFGADAMARAIGLFFPLTLPFTFCAPPLAGWMRDSTGSYNLVILMIVVGSGLVSAMFIGLWHAERTKASAGLLMQQT